MCEQSDDDILIEGLREVAKRWRESVQDLKPKSHKRLATEECALSLEEYCDQWYMERPR